MEHLDTSAGSGFEFRGTVIDFGHIPNPHRQLTCNHAISFQAPTTLPIDLTVNNQS